jgi:hypothetical protein
MERVTKEKIELFISRIEKFDEKDTSLQTDLLIFFLQNDIKIAKISAKEIKTCFDLINHTGLSSLPSYLSNNSKKRPKGSIQKFLKIANGYKISRNYEIVLSKYIGNYIKKVVSDNLFPFEVVNRTRDYIEKVAEQAIIAYDSGIYDACFVMTRKLLEILIIELFERKNISHKIKNSNQDFFYLSDLIDKLLTENSWNLSRNTKQSLPNIKKIGDLSAHNRRFIAKKPDVDKIKNDLRIVIEELIHLIDYPNWK